MNSIIEWPRRCKYAPDYAAFADRDLSPGDPIELCSIAGNICGQCKVDMVDFARLGQNWMNVGCGDCNGANLSGDGNTDMNDLVILTEDWLVGY